MSNNRRNFLKMLGLAPVAATTATAKAEFAPQEFTIEDAVNQVEYGRVVKQGLLGPCCQTGVSYLAITHSGLKREGHEYLCFESTKAEAIKGWLDAALRYSKNRPGILYWRTKLQLDCRVKEDGKEDWVAYSRFVISDYEEIYESVDQMNAIIKSARFG